MIQLDESEFPKKLAEIDKSILDSHLKRIRVVLKENLEKAIQENQVNIQKALKYSLLQIHFLLEEKTLFENALEKLRNEESKTSEKKQLYFDLKLLNSKNESNFETNILDVIVYSKLLMTYARWNLLFPNLLEIRYAAELKKLSKLEWTVNPQQYLLLINLFVDWFARLPNKESFIHIIETRLTQIGKQRNTLEDSKTIDLSKAKSPLSSVKVAVWDTGIDENTVKNVSEDLALYFDEQGNPTKDKMVPLVDVKENDWYLFNGFLDMNFARKSEASGYLFEQLAQFNVEDMTRFRAVLNQFRLYTHGTTVASVAAQENPQIEIVPIRITFDTDPSLRKLFTASRVENELRMHESIANLINKNKIAVVNMSWNYRLQDIENSIMNTTNLTKEERSKLAKELFKKLKESLINLITNCSNTLFVGAAGNYNNNIEEDGNIPCSLLLPNLITIGAVNHEGKRTDFTTIGKTVQLYANGSYVDTILPRGYKSKSSGTSIAAPQVTNLVAVMLSIYPTLNPTTIKEYLLENADQMLEEEISVVNFKRTIQKVLSIVY